MDGKSTAWMSFGFVALFAALCAYLLVEPGRATCGAGGMPPAQVAVAAVQNADLPRYLSGIDTLERQGIAGAHSPLTSSAGRHARATRSDSWSGNSGRIDLIGNDE